MKTPLQVQTAEDLGRAIRSQRKADGLTLAEAAGLINVGVRFLSELENGKPTVRLDKLLRVLSALGLQLHLNQQ
jgi:HTH-type transcriptional regulator/antitoxin HipB